MERTRYQKLSDDVVKMGADIMYLFAMECSPTLTITDFEVMRFRISIAYDQDEISGSQALHLHLLNDGQQKAFEKLFDVKKRRTA